MASDATADSDIGAANLPQSEEILARSSAERLDGRSRVLLEALREIDQLLADMYRGSLDIAARTDNPDNLALAAHGMRELLEKLPRFLDLPVRNQSTLKELANDLLSAWSRWGTTAIDGEHVTAHGKNLLQALNKFCDDYSNDFPSRKMQYALALRNMDRHPLRLPPPIENLHVKHWREIQGFFQGVSHHSRVSTIDEFREYVAALERFLLERLRPRTFDDFAEIDALLRRGD